MSCSSPKTSITMAFNKSLHLHSGPSDRVGKFGNVLAASLVCRHYSIRTVSLRYCRRCRPTIGDPRVKRWGQKLCSYLYLYWVILLRPKLMHCRSGVVSSASEVAYAKPASPWPHHQTTASTALQHGDSSPMCTSPMAETKRPPGSTATMAILICASRARDATTQDPAHLRRPHAAVKLPTAHESGRLPPRHQSTRRPTAYESSLAVTNPASPHLLRAHEARLRYARRRHEPRPEPWRSLRAPHVGRR